MMPGSRFLRLASSPRRQPILRRSNTRNLAARRRKRRIRISPFRNPNAPHPETGRADSCKTVETGQWIREIENPRHRKRHPSQSVDFALCFKEVAVKRTLPRPWLPQAFPPALSEEEIEMAAWSRKKRLLHREEEDTIRRVTRAAPVP